MSPGENRRPLTDADDISGLVGHPRGTLAIVLIFAVLFAAGFFSMFLLRFMAHGAPHTH